jgi:DnaJ-class molecular chaperone
MGVTPHRSLSFSLGSELKKNFYKILGVHQKADPEKIKNAYRRAAKRFHPDVSPKSEEKFKEVQEAYEILSDPEKKAVYDQQILEKPNSKIRNDHPHHSTPIFSPLSIFNDMDVFFTRMEHFWRNDFFGEREENQSDFYIEIIISPEEARVGCELLLKIPIWAICRRCKGTGDIKDLICGLCRGRGEVKIEKKIKVTIPSGIKDGMKIRVPLKDSDLSRTYSITATIRVYR